MKWPLIFNEMIHVGNTSSQVCILTLWTKKENVIAKVDAKNYAVMGQIYSKDEGLSALVRNCLANKNIRHLIVTGADLNGSGQAVVDCFKNGVDKNNKIIGESKGWIDKEIPKKSIDDLRKNVQMHDWRDVKDFSLFNEKIKTFKKLQQYGKPERFPRAKVKTPITFPSEQQGFVIHEDTLGKAWLRILQDIMRFGTIKPSEQHAQQRELLCYTTVIHQDDLKAWEEYFPFSKKEADAYYQQLITKTKIEGVAYTYGERLRNHQGIDQIKELVEKLKISKHTRRAIAFTWDVKTDHNNTEAPCLDVIQAVVQNDSLFLTAYFRSQDMYNAWLMNAYALRKLQFALAEQTKLKVGSLAMISNSAHIYENDGDHALDVLDATKIYLKRIGDPRGDFVITIEGHIKVTHLSPEGKRIDECYGDTAFELYQKLVLEGRVSELSHAFYLGTELIKAELCKKKNMPYVQDKILEF